MKINRETLLVFGILAVLVTLTVIGAVLKAQQTDNLPVLSSFSNQPDGGKALSLWLAALGFEVSTGLEETYTIPPGTGLVLVLEPNEDLLPDNQAELDRWVEAGGTLILAGESWPAQNAMAHYGYNLGYVYSGTLPIRAVSPALAHPPLPGVALVQVNRTLNAFQPPASQTASPTPDQGSNLSLQPGQPLFATPLGLVAARLELGKGQIFLLSAPELLTNRGLKASGNPEIVQNLLNLAQSGSSSPGKAWIDEWHHGLRAASAAIVGPEAWLRQTPGGHALLFSAVLVFLALALSGRSFGRPLPAQASLARRAPLEQITALANLSRRAGHRSRLVQAEYQAVKRRYAHRYHINPDLPDNQFASIVASLAPEVDSASLEHLLTGLTRAMYAPDLSESEMLRLVSEASKWL